MNPRVIRCLALLVCVPALSAADLARRVDAIRIAGDAILICSGDRAFLLTPDEADALHDTDWFVRGDAIVLVVEGKERILALATEDASCDELPSPETETRLMRAVQIERHEDGVFIRLRQSDAVEAYIEGTFTGWHRRAMRPEDGIWSFHKRLKRGIHHFRIDYRLEGDEHWFAEPPRDEDRERKGPRLYTLDVGDRGVSWYLENVEEQTVGGSFGAAYNRVEGFRLSFAIDFEHGIRHRARLGWSQAYSTAAERWS
ncbi:MAG: hypothetical protein ABIH26_04005 [Candidatus Eisenbacteria bacterium]